MSAILDHKPRRLFHMTDLQNVESIIENGLKAMFGNYFCEDMDNCSRFLFTKVLFSGGEGTFAAIQIDTDGLEVERSSDHSPEFFGTDDSWVIWGVVGPEHIVNVFEVTLSLPEAQEEPE